MTTFEMSKADFGAAVAFGQAQALKPGVQAWGWYTTPSEWIAALPIPGSGFAASSWWAAPPNPPTSTAIKQAPDRHWPPLR